MLSNLGRNPGGWESDSEEEKDVSWVSSVAAFFYAQLVAQVWDRRNSIVFFTKLEQVIFLKLLLKCKLLKRPNGLLRHSVFFVRGRCVG